MPLAVDTLGLVKTILAEKKETQLMPERSSKEYFQLEMVRAHRV